MNSGTFIIERTDQGGGMVAVPGSKHSYTNKLSEAWKFTSRELADRQRCPDNEVVVNLFDLILGR